MIFWHWKPYNPNSYLDPVSVLVQVHILGLISNHLVWQIFFVLFNCVVKWYPPQSADFILNSHSVNNSHPFFLLFLVQLIPPTTITPWPSIYNILSTSWINLTLTTHKMTLFGLSAIFLPTYRRNFTVNLTVCIIHISSGHWKIPLTIPSTYSISTIK